ncbi:phage tail assembly chaperone [Stenotrophomonas sp. C1657]|uniref:phage tail assembly chaperone n=1 Tax=Stenotrophomonas sp. C1657 TaxID=3077844 RepID=UPI00293CA5B6|nr:phage tail assembly chaperone [Stenotrophomonas sp. C1657]MDV3515157.1 phage tail assembly chaperone [Stenotrophomonas sp. C1657]
MYAIKGGSYRTISSFDELEAGEEFAMAIPPPLEEALETGKIRRRRDMALRGTDWTQMPDAPLTALERAAYQTYRQALRDLPSVPGFPDVPWPTLPTIKEGAAGTGEDAIYP